MKTIKLFILLLTIATIATSCSKSDDNAEPALAYTQKNIMGRYAITSLTKPNGQVVPYKGYCSTKADVFVALGYYKVYIEKYYGNCPDTWYEYTIATNYAIEPDGRITMNMQNSGYWEGRITELTATKFRIVYDEPTEVYEHSSEPGQTNKYASILYTRLP